MSDESLVDVHEVQSQTADDNTVLDEYQYACDDYHKLHYVDVKLSDCVNSDVKVVSALNDSGVQISVIRSDVLGKLNVPNIGKVKLRGIVGSPVTADLIKINVALSNDDVNDSEYVTVLCAVCCEANDDLVLASSVVDSLYSKQMQLINNAVVIQSDTADDDDECDDELSNTAHHSVVNENDDNDVIVL